MSRTYLIILIFLCIGKESFSHRDPFFSSQKNSKDPVLRFRAAIYPVISFYSLNNNHAQDARQKMSGLGSIKGEIRLNEKHTIFLLVGAEYMVHGVSFYSYYFKQDSLQIYTGNMNYNYNLYVHEIDIPLQLKLSFNKENNSLWTPYVMLGYHFRTIFSGNLTVKQSDGVVVKKYEEVKFKNPLFNPKSNAFASLTFGVQRNNPKHPKRCVFAEFSYRQGFSPYYISDNFTPSSLFINGSHLVFGFGMTF